MAREPVLAAVVVALAGCYPECPAREDVTLSLSVHSDLEPSGGSIVFDSPVLVTSAVTRGTQHDIDVSGPDFEGIERDVRITIDAQPAFELPFAAGDEIRMQYLHDEPLWENDVVAFWRDDDLLLAAIDQAIIIKGSIWLEPLRLEIEDGACPRRSDECGAHERAGVKLIHPDGQSELVMDGRTGTLLGDPGFRVQVAHAVLNYDSLFVPCPTREMGRLRALILNLEP
jgi:hypothetical protein